MSRILIIVQNLPVPFDRRVWLECRALTGAGYDVSVVCPKGKGDAQRETQSRQSTHDTNALRLMASSSHLRSPRELGHEQ